MNFKARLESIGIRYAIFGEIWIAVQLIAGFMFGAFCPGWYMDNKILASFIIAILATDVVGFGSIFLLTHGVKYMPIEKKKMGAFNMTKAIFICYAIMVLGAIVGNVVDWLVKLPFGSGQTDTTGLVNLMLGSGAFMRILTVGILAPIFEELIFRKLLIDRTHCCGEFVSILVSGLMFGLFHGNFSQMFFATGLGMFFALIYVKTGRIWYTILLHMIVNLSTSVVSVFLIQNVSDILYDGDAGMRLMEEDPIGYTIGILLLLGWLLLLLIFAIVGIVFFILGIKRMKTDKYEGAPTKGQSFKLVFGNVGIWAFFILCIKLFIISYFPVF